jgi:hypothetical protein
MLFRYILDYLRNQKLSLPENFSERDRLRSEAEYYGLNNMSKALAEIRPNNNSNGKDVNENAGNATANYPLTTTSFNSNPVPRSNAGYIVVGYRGTFGKSN